MIAHEIREGKVYERNGVTVTAFLVTHGPVKPSYGYRVDYAGHSVALSGDTQSKRQPGRLLQGRGRVDPRGDRSGRRCEGGPEPAT